MTGLKKWFTVPATRDVRSAVAGMSKAAIGDCLIDALALMEGCEADSLTTKHVADFCNPRLLKRGDRQIQNTQPLVEAHCTGGCGDIEVSPQDLQRGRCNACGRDLEPRSAAS